MLRHNHSRVTIGIAVMISLVLIIVGVGLLRSPESKSAFSIQEMKTMAEIWGEALKTRDGQPRYEIMSEKMKEKFIEGQKLRSEPWNFNIGVSSPWVTDYEVTVKNDSAEILYQMTDSTQKIYESKETIWFGKENGKTVVVNAVEDSFAGNFEFEKLVYLSGLSSSTFDYAEDKMNGTKFTISYALFEIQYPDGNKYTLQNPVYIGESMTGEIIKAFEHSTLGEISLKDFKERYQYSIYTPDNQKTNHRLYVLDGQIWLSSYVDNTADKSEIVMNIWKLK